MNDYRRECDIRPLFTEFMQRLNAAKFTPETNLTLKKFVESIYLPFIESETRASTKKGYREIWNNHICDRVGDIRVREFRTVHASKMLRAIAEENDLSKTTLQHIKSVLSGIFTHAKNEGAFDGANPIQGTRIPSNAREPGETMRTTWRKFVESWKPCLCCPKQSLQRRPTRDSAKASCEGWNGRTTQASRLTLIGRFGRTW